MLELLLVKNGEEIMKEDTEKQQKEKKSGHPMFILFIFLVLLGFVFIEPEIYQKLNKNLAEALGIGSKNNKTVNSEPNDDIISVSDYIQIGSSNTLSYNEIIIKNITLSNNILNLDVETTKEIDLEKLHYYIEFYKDKSIFLGRRVLKGAVDKTKKVEIDVNGMDLTDTTFFNISHIEDASIPKFSLETDESGIGSIICSKNNISYTYDFSLDSLIRVVYKYTYEDTNLDSYTNKLLIYQKLAKEYNSLNGLTAVIAENSNTFIYTLELDYSDIKTFNRISDLYIFNKDELSYIIKFKMNAEGFQCI